MGQILSPYSEYFMFNQIATNDVLSANEVANLLLEDALNKMSKITHLDNEQCLKLLASQLPRKSSYIKSKKHTFIASKKPILEQCETQFIHQLFH